MREVAEDFLKALTHDEDPHQKFVFISYRRVTADQELIRTIYERLNQHFGDGTIFLDEETISPGAYWETFIKDQIKSCFFMLVIIDEDWLNYRQEHRKRSIDLREDYVRLEIQLALNAHLIMIPTLIDQADMPTAEQLPPSIKRLAEHQAFRVHSDSSLHPDLDRLIQVIDDTMDTSVSETWKVTGIIPQSEIGDGSD
ncbi:hypothetical protein YTPLAS18_20510 [Nitrospira sp.]|nr:hypothetical protein YTPLAS18_20510 [Nitrospira sp.]